MGRSRRRAGFQTACASYNSYAMPPMPGSMNVRTLCGALAICTALVLDASALSAQNPPPETSAAQKQVGTVKAVNGNSITLVVDVGAEATVLLQDSTRIVLAVPGQRDLQNAPALKVQDLKVGDRVLARGKLSDDGKSLAATSVIVMKGADIAAKQQRERDDWQKRGVGGLVSAVDETAGTVTISTTTVGGSKATTVHVSKDTVVRRYAPDSIRFDDATSGTLAQIKPGDQLRARGTRSADGSELSAEEIVSGTFRSIAGTVVTADASDNSVRVTDLATKKQITLKISGDSQLRTLPPTMAQRIAARLKGGPAAAQPSQVGAANAGSGDKNAEARPGGFGAAGRSGGPPDFQQLLNRMPTVALTDLQKGTPVMIVATEGTDTNPPTAITLLTGVDAILTASPDSGKAAMLLSPWNLGGADAAAGGNP